MHIIKSHPQAWERFTDALRTTDVAYLYVSEHHLEGTGLKIRMRDAIRENRKYVIVQVVVTGMWHVASQDGASAGH